MCRNEMLKCGIDVSKGESEFVNAHRSYNCKCDNVTRLHFLHISMEKLGSIQIIIILEWI